MKKALVLVLVLALALSMAACGTAKPAASASASPAAASAAPSAASKTLNVAVVLKTLSSEYWQYVEAGAKAAAKDLNVNVTVVGPNAESDISGQVTMIEEQLSQNVDAIVCAPNDSSAASTALSKAVGKIPVLFVDTDAKMDGKTAFIGTGNEAAAEIGGKYVADQLGKGKNAVIVYGQEGDNTSNARKQGYETALKAGGINILGEQSGNNTTDGATATMEDMLSRFPGKIDAVLCMNDDTAIGVYNACKSANISKIMIVGFDGNKSAVNLILDGKKITATVAQQPYKMGYTAVETAVKAAKGEKVEASIPVEAQLVTSDNAQKYLDTLKSYLS